MRFNGFLKGFFVSSIRHVFLRRCTRQHGRVGVSGQRGDVEPEVAEPGQEVLGPGDLHESEPGQLRSP